MILTKEQKDELKKELVLCLGSDEKVKKIVVFGSFINSNDPVGLDVAVFQESNEPYLPLSMKYRRKTRSIGDKIPIDIFPVRQGSKDHSFLSEIAQEKLSMRDETKTWLKYANENFQSAKVLFDSSLFNSTWAEQRQPRGWVMKR